MYIGCRRSSLAGATGAMMAIHTHTHTHTHTQPTHTQPTHTHTHTHHSLTHAHTHTNGVMKIGERSIHARAKKKLEKGVFNRESVPNYN